MFVILDIIILFMTILAFVFILKEIEILFLEFRENKSKSLKSIKLRVKGIFIFMVLISSILIIMVVGYFLFWYNDSFAFIRSVNNVVENYYKEVDKRELLKSAFESVLEQLDDPYAEIMDSNDMSFFYNKNKVLGYGLNLKDNDVYVFDVNNELSNQDTIKNDDKIVSANGVELSR